MDGDGHVAALGEATQWDRRAQRHAQVARLLDHPRSIGSAVTPVTYARRVSSSMKNNT